MNLQAIISNPDGTPAANREIGMKFCIKNSNGSTIFSEEAKVKSNDQGLVEYAIGSSSKDGLSSVDWKLMPNLHLQVWIDLNGGKNYLSAYDSTIQSVPTALYSEKSGDYDNVVAEINDTKKSLEDRIFELRANMESLISYLYNTDAVLDAKINELTDDSQSYDTFLKAEIDVLKSKIDNMILTINDLTIENIKLKVDVEMLKEQIMSRDK